MIISYRHSLRGHLILYGSFSGLNLSILTLIIFHAPHSGHFAHISSGYSHIQAMTIFERFMTTIEWGASPLKTSMEKALLARGPGQFQVRSAKRIWSSSSPSSSRTAAWHIFLCTSIPTYFTGCHLGWFADGILPFGL